MIDLINQIYEIQRKADEINAIQFKRNFERIFVELEEMGYHIQIPINKKYNENDTSIEGMLLHNNSDMIKKVLKPIIYKKEGDSVVLVQKGIVIVE